MNSVERLHEKPNLQQSKAESLGPVRVQCLGFRCLAYRDANGSWREFLTDRPLERVIGLVRYNLTDLLPVTM